MTDEAMTFKSVFGNCPSSVAADVRRRISGGNRRPFRLLTSAATISETPSKGMLREIFPLWWMLAISGQVVAAEAPIREIQETKDPSRAALRVRVLERAANPIPKYITGKIAEHLGANIYNGMDAQILRNPTFADYPFSTGQMSPDGITRFYSDDQAISRELRRQASRWGWPESELDRLVTAHADGLACFWGREGGREAGVVSQI